MVKTGASLPPPYRQLQRQLARLGYVSQGSVFERGPGQQGSRYVWTRKVRAKTVTVALFPGTIPVAQASGGQPTELEHIVEQMQTLSRQILFENIPGRMGRKRLSKKSS